MIDARDGVFQLQARTRLAQQNSTNATIFSAGAAKEENTSIVEVKVKKGGETHWDTQEQSDWLNDLIILFWSVTLRPQNSHFAHCVLSDSAFLNIQKPNDF